MDSVEQAGDGLVGPIVRNEFFFFVVILGAAALLVLREWLALRASRRPRAGGK